MTRAGLRRGAPTFAEALIDPALFGATFGGSSFATWRTIAKAMDGLALDDTERSTFTMLTDRPQAPTRATDEIWWIKGRRAGGSLVASVSVLKT